MTLRGIAKRTAVITAICWLSATSNAHVVDLGTLERLHEQLATQLEPQGLDGREQVAVAARPSIDMYFAILPGGKRTDYTVGDVVPEINGSLALGTGTARTLYRDVVSLAGRPKTETWLALLVVACLIGVQLRRTQRLLHHRPLAR